MLNRYWHLRIDFCAEAKPILACIDESIRNSHRQCISTIFQPYKMLVLFNIRGLHLDGQIVNFSHYDCMGGNVLLNCVRKPYLL